MMIIYIIHNKEEEDECNIILYLMIIDDVFFIN